MQHIRISSANSPSQCVDLAPRHSLLSPAPLVGIDLWDDASKMLGARNARDLG